MTGSFFNLKDLISEEEKILESLSKNPNDKNILNKLKKKNDAIPEILSSLIISEKLQTQEWVKSSEKKEAKIMNFPAEKNSETFVKMQEAEKVVRKIKSNKSEKEAIKLQGDVMKRIKKGEKNKEIVRQRKPNPYVKIANNFFSKTSLSMYKNEAFSSLRKDLIQANLNYLPVSYISTILFTTLLAFFGGVLLMILMLFIDVTIKFPFFIFYNGEIIDRFIKVFWVMFAAPVTTFLIMYFYPSVERNYIKDKINQELPFVTIHMAAIAGSMIEPSKVFEILTITKEYPYTSKEFTKIINDINIYGYNLVAALRGTSMNTASSKLAELLNGVATSITSGGDIQKFFEKKSQSLLFDYRLQRERYTRMAETFMDIYISVVIAAPMILMLLLMMIKISGLGLSLSTETITILMVGGVAVINIIFITFLYLKQPES